MVWLGLLISTEGQFILAQFSVQTWSTLLTLQDINTGVDWCGFRKLICLASESLKSRHTGHGPLRMSSFSMGPACCLLILGSVQGKSREGEGESFPWEEELGSPLPALHLSKKGGLGSLLSDC